MLGAASVEMADVRLGKAIDLLREATANIEILGVGKGEIFARLVEALFLDEGSAEELKEAVLGLISPPNDQRYAGDVAPALAVADHLTGECNGRCQRRLTDVAEAGSTGAKLVASIGREKIGALSLEHRAMRPKRMAWVALSEAVADGYAALIRPWIRRYARHAEISLQIDGCGHLLADLLDWDPDGWRTCVVQLLPQMTGHDRRLVLAAIARHANRSTLDALRAVTGEDVAQVRRRMQHLQATRLYLRTLGGISLRRNGWDGPPIEIDKRRVKALLAVLAAHAHTTLTRDRALDLLWPEADGDAAINNLNQTVFQLRRYLDHSYRQGESPEYVISTSEHLKLADDLIRSDVAEIRKVLDQAATATFVRRNEAAAKALVLFQG